MFVMWCYFSDFVIYLWLWFRVFLWFLSCYVHACDWEILNVLCLWLWFKRFFFNSLKLPPFTHLVVVHSKYCLFTYICTIIAPFPPFFGFTFDKSPAKTYRFATPTLKIKDFGFFGHRFWTRPIINQDILFLHWKHWRQLKEKKRQYLDS